MKITLTVPAWTFFLTLALTPGSVIAQTNHAGQHSGHGSAEAGVEVVSGLSYGTIRRVNADAGKLTITHGPLANLDMPPMTMTFRLSGDASLDGLASGDKVRFAADKDGDVVVVTRIETAGN